MPPNRRQRKESPEQCYLRAQLSVANNSPFHHSFPAAPNVQVHVKFTSNEDNDPMCISIPPPMQIHSPLINNQPIIETNMDAMFAGWLLETNSGGNNKDFVEENHHHPVMKEIRNHLDWWNVIAAGFYYGTATSVWHQR